MLKWPIFSSKECVKCNREIQILCNIIRWNSFFSKIKFCENQGMYFYTSCRSLQSFCRSWILRLWFLHSMGTTKISKTFEFERNLNLCKRSQKDSVIHWFNDHNSKTKPFMTRCCLATVHYYMYNKKQNENKDKKRWEKIFEVFNICLNLKSEVKLYLYSFSVRFQIISEWLTIVRVPSYLF